MSMLLINQLAVKHGVEQQNVKSSIMQSYERFLKNYFQSVGIINEWNYKQVWKVNLSILWLLNVRVCKEWVKNVK